MKNLLVIFYLLIVTITAVNSNPLDGEVLNTQNETSQITSKLQEDLKNLEIEFIANETRILTEINKLEEENQSYEERFKKYQKVIEERNKELGIKEMNIKRTQLQNEFDELLHQTKQISEELSTNRRKFRYRKADCVYNLIEEENCTKIFNEFQVKISNYSKEMLSIIPKIAEKQQEISDHEEVQQIALDEMLKVLKEFIEIEKPNIAEMKKIEGNFIEKQYELEKLRVIYELRKNELKGNAENGNRSLENSEELK